MEEREVASPDIDRRSAEIGSRRPAANAMLSPLYRGERFLCSPLTTQIAPILAPNSGRCAFWSSFWRICPHSAGFGRDSEGSVSEAFGFSLAPLLARSDEIEAIAAAVVADRLALQRLRERLTIARRDAAKLIKTGMEEGVLPDWEDLHLRHRQILATVSRKSQASELSLALDTMEALRDEIYNRLETLANSRILSGNDQQNERHIQNSDPETYIESEALTKHEQGEMPVLERKAMREPLKIFPLGMVLKACPDIADYGPGGSISSWRDLMKAAVVVRKMLGVSPSACQEACEIMGPENAAVAMACILERAGHINSAGRYLRDLTRKAERGKFGLGPMLMALGKGRGVGAATAAAG